MATIFFPILNRIEPFGEWTPLHYTIYQTLSLNWIYLQRVGNSAEINVIKFKYLSTWKNKTYVSINGCACDNKIKLNVFKN